MLLKAICLSLNDNVQLEVLILEMSFFNIFVKSSAAFISDIQKFTDFEQLLVVETGIHANNYWYVSFIFFSDFSNNSAYHFTNGVTMIRVV